VDDTGARHAAKSGFCTQIGDDRFTPAFAGFATRSSKSRLNSSTCWLSATPTMC
jgi:hypothetical protein